MDIFDVLLNQTFPVILTWATQHGYPIIFLLMVVEGQILTAAMAFANTFGYFSLPAIFLLAFFGDIVGDLMWYAIGYYGSAPLIRRFGHLFKVKPEQMEKLRHFFEKHPGKSLVVIKFSPILPAPGLIMAGSSRMSFRKFITVISVIIVPKTLLFMALGYFFGNIFGTLYKYVKNGLYIVVILVLVVWLAVYLYRKWSGKFSEKLEEES